MQVHTYTRIADKQIRAFLNEMHVDSWVELENE